MTGLMSCCWNAVGAQPPTAELVSRMREANFRGQGRKQLEGAVERKPVTVLLEKPLVAGNGQDSPAKNKIGVVVHYTTPLRALGSVRARGKNRDGLMP